MRVSRKIFICACVLALSLAGAVSAAAVDPKPASSNRPPTTTTASGKIDVTFSISIPDSWIPSDDQIGCEVTITVQGEPQTYRETGALAASRNGDTATCTVGQFYSWAGLQNEPTDTISLTFDVIVPPESIGSITLPYRENVQSMTMLHIPPTNGTVTRITVDVTL
jgi:hypothetical protein